MSEERPDLAEAARAIAAGDTVAWDRVATKLRDDASTDALLRALHDVAAIEAFHRSWPPSPLRVISLSPGTWGALTIEREIGRGAFSRVYLASDPRLDRHIALKVIDRGVVGDAADGRAVIEEGKHLARLRHPNVVSIYGAQWVDGQAALEMELVTGRTLAEIVQTDGPLGADEAAVIGRDVARALAAVHGAGLVHRDVKAQNVVREQGGRIVLMDLGAGGPIERVRTSSITGTPLYIAPEVLEGAASTAKSDLYSLGVLLYFLVTASFPVQAAGLDELRGAHRSGKRTHLRDGRPDLPEPFIQLVERALSSDPAVRIESAGRFEAELSNVLGHIRREAPASSSVRRRGLVAATMVGALLLGAFVLWPRTPTGLETTASIAPPARSIAVLPFVNRSDGADEYFADGMTDELISALGKVPGLRVAARTSAFSFKGRPIEARAVAKELGVETVLEGTVRRSGTLVRVTASLVSGADGLQLWSSTFQNDGGDAFAVQDEVTRAVVSGLSLQLGGMALLASQAGRTRDPEAHDLYLRGLALMNTATEPNLRRALEFYQQAIVRDPAFAQAYAGVAATHSWLADAYVAPNEAYRAAQAAAAAALQRDELLADAHALFGYAVVTVDWDSITAEREFRRALEIDPNSVTALAYYGTYLCVTGRPSEADVQIGLATQLDPLSPLLSWMREWCGHASHRYGDVIAAHKRTQAIAPGFWYLDTLVAAAYRELGNYPAAIREYEAAARSTGMPQYGLAITFARLGRKEEARSIVRSLDERARQVYVPFLFRAAAHGAVGEMDAGVALLQQSFNAREPVLIGALPKPELTELLQDPRARRIVDEANARWRK